MNFLRNILLLVSVVMCSTSIAFAQIPKYNTDDFIINVLKGTPDWFQQIVYNPQEYQVQIVYTQINRDSSNRAHFSTHTFQADEFYFYPASWMKLPLAVFSLEKLNELKLNKNDVIRIEPLFGNHNHEYDDLKNIQPLTIAEMAKRAFIVSENSVFNPMYDFVTQQRANQRFSEIGLQKAVLCNRFSVSDPQEHRHSNFLEVLKNGNVVYQQIQSFNPTQPHCTFANYQFGEKHYEKGVLVNEPKNFYYNNYIPLTEMDLFMRKLFFPKETHTQWNLTKDDFTFLKKYLAILPRQCVKPKFDEANFPDCYMKYFMIGGSKDRLDGSIRIFDKLGQYFGWTCDAAYIVDYSTGVEFFISAVIYTNSQHIVADNQTEYANIAAPFFAQLGKAFYEYESNRKKKFTPHLNYVSLTMDDGVEIKNEDAIVTKSTQKESQTKHSAVSKSAVVAKQNTTNPTAKNSTEKKTKTDADKKEMKSTPIVKHSANSISKSNSTVSSKNKTTNQSAKTETAKTTHQTTEKKSSPPNSKTITTDSLITTKPLVKHHSAVHHKKKTNHHPATIKKNKTVP